MEVEEDAIAMAALEILQRFRNEGIDVGWSNSLLPLEFGAKARMNFGVCVTSRAKIR